MEKVINNAWKIARGIISTCDSRADINRFIKALRDQQAREEIIMILLAVSNALGSQLNPSPRKLQELGNATTYSPESLLRDMFRKRLKMSNQEVERWLVDRFGVRQRIGKSSLREYLRLILKSDSEAIGGAILSQAAKDFESILGNDSDLKKYWEGLDAQINGDDNASIQGRTREFPSKPKES
ncbi:MAG: hypothetical protein WB588_08490 [Dehalococcoidia bacterium]